MGDESSPLEGFPWRGGADRDTTGILMWSEPFEAELPNGDKVYTVFTCLYIFDSCGHIILCFLTANLLNYYYVWF